MCRGVLTLMGPAVLGVAQRALPALKVSPRLAALRDALPCRDPLVASLGYREPSLVFLIGTGLALPPDGAAARQFLEAGGCRLLFVEARDRDDFNAAWPVGRGVPAPLAEVDGFNLSRLVVPESYADFIDLVIPELQDRGLYKTAYAPGTLRNKLFGAGDRRRRVPLG